MTDNERYFNYKSYIESEVWREKARQIRKRDGHRCIICGAQDVPLEVHHLTYDRFGHEREDDLITVCHKCHERITELWNNVRGGINARKRVKALFRRYSYARDLANHLNKLMPLDISFGGEHVLTGHENIRAACVAVGIEYRFAARIEQTFNTIHVIDVVTQYNNGVPKNHLLNKGYPASLVNNIKKRQYKHDQAVSSISDELVCYIHNGEGKWTVCMNEDGLDSTFDVRFMPYIRYENRWWDDE